MIYIILPIYNEADVIGKLLEKIDNEMKNNSYEYKILAINDGSTDNTVNVIRLYQKTIPLDLVDFKENRGVGEVFRCGFEHVVKKAQNDDMVVTMDADNTHEPRLIKMMQTKLNEGYDVIIASCLATGGGVVGVPILRHLMLIVCNRLYQTLFPIRGIREYTGFYRAYSADALKKAFLKFGPTLIEADGFAAMAEFLIKLRKISVRISEVPLILRYDQKGEKSKLKVFPTIKEHLKVIFKNLL
ncbi:MAG: glycosyltransferase family 2 protein [Candidatus Omnitrophica bacterium]|nr:glycosyltransferase family 2 protein [Candidatus Omnitrophota bacterium]